MNPPGTDTAQQIGYFAALATTTANDILNGDATQRAQKLRDLRQHILFITLEVDALQDILEIVP